MRTSTRLALVLGTLAALGAGARVSEAHIVPTGVGTQTWIDVRPRKIAVRFNLGFSSLLGLGELRLADANKDGKIDAAEEDAYLVALADRVIPQLRLFVDGKRLDWKVLSHQAAGIRGAIDRVAFDTFFDLEADVALGPGPHQLDYEEGTYKEEVSQQILYVITARAADFKDFFSETKTPGAPVMEQEGALQYFGREADIKFEFRPQTLERDRAEAILEPVMMNLQDSIDTIAGEVARTAEVDLRPLACGEVSLRGSSTGLPGLSPIGFMPRLPSAPTASDRGAQIKSVFATEEDAEGDAMTRRTKDPFAVATILFFLVAGAIHAKGPGHGKTMVAAYLMGTKGRIWDAVRLGAIVTFTHTFALYTFGLGLVYLVDQAKQQRVATRALFLITLCSGITLAIYGIGLAWRRKRNLAKADAAAKEAALAPHTHTHEAPKPLAAASGKRLLLAATIPVEVPAHTHSHGDGGHTHSHGDGEHSHSHDSAHGDGGHSHAHDGSMDEAEHAALHAREAATEISSWRDLLTLGISSGLTPCPAGFTLIVWSLSLPEQSTLKAFVYLNAFSLGLGSVLVGIAVLMVLSKKYLASAFSGKRARWLQVLPVYSAMLVAVIGGTICYEAFDPNYKNAIAKVSRVFTQDQPGKAIQKIK
jgi:ABC-type nickel/cobalt efflux system permease component RcnA